jgi:hypothetical protein
VAAIGELIDKVLVQPAPVQAPKIEFGEILTSTSSAAKAA